ncbi:ABC1-domain-containing protein [Fomitiporia mediterranea MF3/22]|uniref:ABC1-domain-containing protein n=1 Tax=Fomitiporia mediterranea (strain MF3/22) TaxID=694068 RepID=UPI0004407793|nr:ABC1-domain-containing protein [Fomitiporia mediterranea MF3/22]EJD05228.1 ABC1-domain-containing protein [Fomitiporia mediterranea MF3/22]
MMTPANIKRLVERLSKMRGAALKLGQFMSIQDTHLLPKDVEEVFRRVQDSAHYMPNWQMERVMSDALGPSWSSNFASFDPIPFAAASLGQVHSAVLAAHASPTSKDERVAVKIQFPNIEKSIESDLGYLKVLLNAGRILPRGLFLDKTLQVMKGELADECNYTREAECIRFFCSENAVGNDSRFRVPWVWNGSTERVLVMQRMDGVSVGGNVVDSLSQYSRDQIASTILELCMKELFEFRMMQTDPNWSNFLWNEQTRQIELIDFGATRSYSKQFIDKWMHVLQAAVNEDRERCIHWSLELGYLTGKESETMLDAHIRSLTLLATPFRGNKSPPPSSGTGPADPRYEFGRGSEWTRITAEIRSLIPVMLRERLTPPPRETYSLNRKLSGAFLLASRLGAKVDCKGIWDATVNRYQFASSPS